MPDKKIECWYQDEMRFGQKTRLTRVWAARGSCPRAIQQNGFKNGYIIGAVNPVTGKREAVVADGCDTALMNELLKSIARNAGDDVHIILVVDGAGWHRSSKLVVPQNISLLFLPPYCPELNPIERLWKFIKDRFLSNTVFKDTAEIIEKGSLAWMKLDNEIVRSVCHTEYAAS